MQVAEDMREFVSLLEAKGEIVRVRREADPYNFELSSLIRHEEDGSNRAILFERVKGYDIPVVANIYGSVRRCALGLGIEPSEDDVKRCKDDPHGSAGALGGLSERLHKAFTLTDQQRTSIILFREKVTLAEGTAAQGLYRPQILSSGPCQEVIITRDIDLMGTFPMPWLCEKDAGPFINPGILVQRDPETGVLNLGCRRHQVGGSYGKDKIGAFVIESTDGGRILRKYEAMGKPAEVALCLGVDPAVEFMGCYNSTHLMSPTPFSEYDIVGALMGRPLDLVKCKTVDIEVPASTEIVIEGIIHPEEKILEGPMAEYTDMYTWKRLLPFIHITAITHRRNPMVHVLLSGRSMEMPVLGMMVTGFGTEKRILAKARHLFPTVKDVAIYGGSQNFHLVVSLKKRFEGEDKLLLYYLMATTFHKFITLVDDDIEPHNMEQVEWAKAMRAGATADSFTVFPKTHTWEMDPQIDDEIRVTRLGILATMPVGQKYARSGPPLEMLEKTKAIYKEELSNR